MPGYDEAIVPFVQALSSAPNLRDLKIMSLSTLRNFAAQAPTPSSRITLPGLRSLHIEDLHLNTLEYLVQILAPACYKFTLFPTHKVLTDNILLNATVTVIEEVETEETRRTRIFNTLKWILVDTLVVSGYVKSDWLSTPNFFDFLRAMPTLKTLRVYYWYFYKELCQGLTPVNNDRAPSKDYPFPALRNLYLTWINIPNEEDIQSIITSHPLQLVELEGSFWVSQTNEWAPLHENSSAVQWLRRNRSDLELRLVEKGHAPEFYSHEWRLW